MLRSSDNLICHVEFGYNNGVFVYSLEFAAERWNNIWERYNFHGFLDFAWYCKESGDDVYGQEGQSLFSKLTLLHAMHLQVNLDVLVQLYFSWMCMMVFQQQQTNLFQPNCVFAFSGSCVMFFQLFHGQGERFWNFVMSLKLFENVLEMVMNSTT